MYTTFVILLSFLGVVHMQVELTASYTTSFKCKDGSYALISGDNLTLEYDYGKEHDQLQSFHLKEKNKQRHMFDFENPTGHGTPYIKDSQFNRLKSFNWTDTGIKLVIENISNETDQGRYQGEVEIPRGQYVDYALKTLQITEISDPPAEVKLTTPSGVMDSINLKKGFNEYILEFSAVSYNAIQCNSVEIICTVTDGWSGLDNSMTPCSAKDASEPTKCTLTLKEANMIEGKCVTVGFYAEQYGVQSEKKNYIVCYQASGVLVGLMILHYVGVIAIFIVAVIFIKRRKNARMARTKNEVYKPANNREDVSATTNTETPASGMSIRVLVGILILVAIVVVIAEVIVALLLMKRTSGKSTGVLVGIIIMVAIVVVIPVVIVAVLFMKRRQNVWIATTERGEYNPANNPDNREDVSATIDNETPGKMATTIKEEYKPANNPKYVLSYC